MKKITFKDQMYIGLVVIIPNLMLFKGAVNFFIISVLASLVIIQFDPLFKRFLSEVEYARRYLKLLFGSGIGSGCIAIIYPVVQPMLLGIWCLFFVIYTFRIVDRIEKLNSIE